MAGRIITKLLRERQTQEWRDGHIHKNTNAKGKRKASQQLKQTEIMNKDHEGVCGVLCTHRFDSSVDFLVMKFVEEGMKGVCC